MTSQRYLDTLRFWFNKGTISEEFINNLVPSKITEAERTFVLTPFPRPDDGI